MRLNPIAMALTAVQLSYSYNNVSTPNKDFLRDFVKLNKINVSRVSIALGHTRSWLETMYSKSKYDISDETLKSILKKLHIDWASKEFLYVDAEVPYRTKPCNYKLDKHKEELQKLFWIGKVTA